MTKVSQADSLSLTGDRRYEVKSNNTDGQTGGRGNERLGHSFGSGRDVGAAARSYKRPTRRIRRRKRALAGQWRGEQRRAEGAGWL